MMKKLFIFLFGLSFLIGSTVFAQGYNTRLPLPGTSVANTKLQYDTLPPVYMAVGIKALNCNNMKVIDTKVTKQPYNLEYRGQQVVGGHWEELWSVNACSKIYDVPIEFILDDTGASYVISPKNVILR